MKGVLIIFSFVASLYLVDANTCKLTNSITRLSDMADSCAESIRAQIQMEIDASMHYMMMGAHFSQDNINRPGFAKFFFKSASEEREHGYKLMEYLVMRGLMTTNLKDTIKLTKVTAQNVNWESGLHALNKALELEKSVTKSITNIMVTCEQDKDKNDYHAVDYLINEFLDEQYKGQKHLADMISKLNRMESAQGSIAEWMFDKELLKDESA